LIAKPTISTPQSDPRVVIITPHACRAEIGNPHAKALAIAIAFVFVAFAFQPVVSADRAEDVSTSLSVEGGFQ
jgi:hypothetical protein